MCAALASPDKHSADAAPDAAPDTGSGAARTELLLRYARGRVAHFAARQVLTLTGGFVLILLNNPAQGIAAIVVALFGEAVDCLYLRSVPVRLARGEPPGRIYVVSTVIAGFQAVTITICIGLAWFGPTSHSSMLFAIAFLSGAAINGGLVLPYHRAAAIARLAVYGVAAIALFAGDAMVFGDTDTEFVLNAVGTAMLAYMVFLFLQFVDSGFRRHRQNAIALTEKSRALEMTNRQLQLRQKEAQQLSMVAKNANDSVILSNADGRIAWVNDAFTRITGFTQKEAIGMLPGDLLNAPQTDPETTAAIARAVAEGEAFRGEIQNATKDGRLIWIETNQVPVLDSAGRVEMMVAIERDVTEAKQIARDLARAKRAAEDGARAKAEFLATMSHEIRTPMNGVIGMADLICETSLSADQRLYAETIRNSAQALLTILNDILDLSKLDAGKMVLNPVDFDLRECLSGTLDLLRPQAKDKGLRCDLAIATELPGRVRADDGRLRQILINLIGNAIKFTKHGGVTVRVRLAHRDGAAFVVVDVEDTGIGIEEGNLNNVFERFAQAETSTTRRFGGTGLGLTISRMLAEAMGGDIRARSRPGRGSCFSLALPLVPAAGPAPFPAADPAAPADREGLSGMRVLVAEDNKINRLLIRKFLCDLPVMLMFAHDGRQALEMFRHQRPDLVFMDMSMPIMGGIEATRHIRASGLPQPAIVALTANAFASDKAACLEAGMDGFLSKPVRRAELLAALKDYGAAVVAMANDARGRNGFRLDPKGRVTYHGPV